MTVQDPAASADSTPDPYTEVAVRYDRRVAEEALARVKRTVVIMMLGSAVTIAMMLVLAFGVFDGPARVVFIAVAILSVVTQFIVLPRLMLSANTAAARVPTDGGLAFTMGSEGIRLPDEAHTRDLRWDEVELGPGGTPQNPSEVMIALKTGGEERTYYRDALTPDADTVLATATRLRG